MITPDDHEAIRALRRRINHALSHPTKFVAHKVNKRLLIEALNREYDEAKTSGERGLISRQLKVIDDIGISALRRISI